MARSGPAAIPVIWSLLRVNRTYRWRPHKTPPTVRLDRAEMFIQCNMTHRYEVAVAEVVS